MRFFAAAMLLMHSISFLDAADFIRHCYFRAADA